MAKQRNDQKQNSAGSAERLLRIIAAILIFLWTALIARTLGEMGTAYFHSALIAVAATSAAGGYFVYDRVSSYVRSRAAREQFGNVRRVTICGVILAVLFGVIGTGVLFLAGNILLGNSAGLKEVITVFWFSLPLPVIGSIIGLILGYLHGLNMDGALKLALPLFVAVGLILSLRLTSVMAVSGEKISALLQNENFIAAYGAAGAVLGMVICAVAFLILSLVFLFPARRIYSRKALREEKRGLERIPALMQALLWSGIPSLSTAVLYLMLPMIDQIVYYKLAGTSAAEVATYGIYAGQFCCIELFIFYLSGLSAEALMPGLRSAYSQGMRGRSSERVSVVLQSGLDKALISAMFCAVCAEPLSVTLYHTQTTISAVKYLQIGAVVIIAGCVARNLGKILDALDCGFVKSVNNLIASAVHLVCILLIPRAQDSQIIGILECHLISFLVLTVLHVMQLMRHVTLQRTLPVRLATVAGIDCAAAILMLLPAKLLGQVLPPFAACILAAVIGYAAHTALILVLQVYRPKDLMRIPMGSIVVRIGQRFGLY